MDDHHSGRINTQLESCDFKIDQFNCLGDYYNLE